MSLKYMSTPAPTPKNIDAIVIAFGVTPSHLANRAHTYPIGR